MDYKKLSREEKRQYIQSRINKGMSVRDIAKSVGVSAMTISRHAKQLGVKVLSRIESTKKKNTGKKLSLQHRMKIARTMFYLTEPTFKKLQAVHAWDNLSRIEKEHRRNRMRAVRATRTKGSKLRRFVKETVESFGYTALTQVYQNGFKAHIYITEVNCVIQFNTSQKMLYAFRINKEEYLDKIKAESIIWGRNGKGVIRISSKGWPGLYKRSRLANILKKTLREIKAKDIMTLDVDAEHSRVKHREDWIK